MAKTGRPPKLSPEALGVLRRLVEARPLATARKLCAALGNVVTSECKRNFFSRSGTADVRKRKTTRPLSRDYDKHPYKQRHRVESAFLNLKQWRGIATRYAKRLSSFLAAAQIRCLGLWLRVS
jgi:hypothetical protein